MSKRTTIHGRVDSDFVYLLNLQDSMAENDLRANKASSTLRQIRPFGRSEIVDEGTYLANLQADLPRFMSMMDSYLKARSWT